MSEAKPEWMMEGKPDQSQDYLPNDQVVDLDLDQPTQNVDQPETISASDEESKDQPPFEMETEQQTAEENNEAAVNDDAKDTQDQGRDSNPYAES